MLSKLLKKIALILGHNTATMSGRYRFIATNSVTGEHMFTTPWIENLVVNNAGRGVQIVADRLVGITTNDLVITKAKIGTGTTAPADGDTDLQTSVFTKNSVASAGASGNVASLSFFITTTELANGTYTEFGIFAVNQLIARSIISPSYVKGTNQDTTVEYEITVANS